jgi:hypothetical protein
MKFAGDREDTNTMTTIDAARPRASKFLESRTAQPRDGLVGEIHTPISALMAMRHAWIHDDLTDSHRI